MLTKAQFLLRARLKTENADDYWGRLVNLVDRKPGIGIGDRGEYTQPEWNWLQQGKASLTMPWE